MNIENGWRFYTADFSLQSAGKSDVGNVTFRRDPENTKKWLELSEEDRENTDLHITASGKTIIDAIINANLIAAHTKDID